jgi:hypothetical protein
MCGFVFEVVEWQHGDGLHRLGRCGSQPATIAARDIPPRIIAMPHQLENPILDCGKNMGEY